MVPSHPLAFLSWVSLASLCGATSMSTRNRTRATSSSWVRPAASVYIQIYNFLFKTYIWDALVYIIFNTVEWTGDGHESLGWLSGDNRFYL